jgi:hypothetical protein
MRSKLFLAIFFVMTNAHLVSQNIFTSTLPVNGAYALSETGTSINLSNLPSELEIPTAYGLKLIHFQTENKVTFGDVTLVNGSIKDQRVPRAGILNAILTVHRESSVFTILFEDHDGSFYVTPRADGSNKWVVKENKTVIPCGNHPLNKSNFQKEGINDSASHLEEQSTTKKKTVDCSPAGGSIVCTEQDSVGDFVIDVFIGYSNEAVTYLGGGTLYQNHAAAQVQSVNQALTNSQIDSVYLRLVGTAIKNHNGGINLTSTGLDYVPTLFESEMISSGADYICMYQEYYNTSSYNTAGGWATVQGRNSICMVEDNTVFRHEIGHNFGSNHCSGGSTGYSFANGYDNGYEKTIMCGNDIGYYSTTTVNVNSRSIGTAFNDNARLLKERKSIIAQHATHRIAYHSNDPCFDPGVVAIDFPIHVPPLSGDRIEQVQFGTINNLSTDATCEDVVGYSDYRSISTSHLRGDQISFTVTNGWNWPGSQSHMWIDWNADGIFQTTELIAHTYGNQVFTGTITVPQSISLGPKVVRIRREFATNPYTPHPVNSSNYSGGETEDYTLNVYSGIGLNESDQQYLFVVAPNPVLHSFQIIGPYASLAEVTLHNASGLKISTFTLGKGQTIDISHLSSGMYFLKFMYNGKTHNLKLVK